MITPPTSSSSNILIIMGSLTGIAFILVGGIVALAYTDGQNASIILPVLLGLVGPLILSIISLAKGVENGQKADTAVQQNVEIARMLETLTTPPATTTVVTRIPSPPSSTEVPPIGPN